MKTTFSNSKQLAKIKNEIYSSEKEYIKAIIGYYIQGNTVHKKTYLDNSIVYDDKQRG